jgi:hypothetical protein
MSKHNQTIQLAVPAERLLLFCQEVFDDFGWRVQEVTRYGMTAKESAPHLTSSTWPARIDLEVVAVDEDSSELRVFGSITGLGPIQNNHLKGQVGRFLNSLSVRIDNTSKQGPARVADSTATLSLASELRELAELHRAGVLSDSEFEAAKAQLLRRN